VSASRATALDGAGGEEEQKATSKEEQKAAAEEAEEEAEAKACDKVFPTRLDPPREWMHKAFPPGSYFMHGFEEQVVCV
jgi:hypothetical protein